MGQRGECSGRPPEFANAATGNQPEGAVEQDLAGSSGFPAVAAGHFRVNRAEPFESAEPVGSWPLTRVRPITFPSGKFART